MRTPFASVVTILCVLISLPHQLVGGDVKKPTPIILDTDIGNDIDDLLALAMLHAAADKGQCRLVAVTVSKDHHLCAPFVDMVNTFYLRPKIPIGVVRHGATPEAGKYMKPLLERRVDGRLAYPRDVRSGKDAPGAVSTLRRALAAEQDNSVVVCVIGFSTNLGRLLSSKPDTDSPLSGVELVSRKVKLLSMMAGQFVEPQRPEYNVVTDKDAASLVFSKWPTPVLVSGFEIGNTIHYPAKSIEKDFGGVKQHPVPEAYRLFRKMPYDSPCWDLTAVLAALEPEADHFGLSPLGRVSVDARGVTRFTPDAKGRVRYLSVTEKQRSHVQRRLIELVAGGAKRRR